MNVEQAFNFFRVRGTTLGQRVRVVTARLFGVGQEGDTDEQQEPIEDAECLSPVGFKSRPKVGAHTEAFGVRLGDEVVVLCFVDKGGATLSDADLAEGEALMYGPAEPAATVRITKDGDVVVTAKPGRNVILKAPDGGEVRLNEGGTGYAGKEVARKDDQVEVTIPSGTFLIAADAGVTNPTPVTVTGKINVGAQKIKG